MTTKIPQKKFKRKSKITWNIQNSHKEALLLTFGSFKASYIRVSNNTNIFLYKINNFNNSEEALGVKE